MRTATSTNGRVAPHGRSSPRDPLTPSAILGALPPPALILTGIISVQVGAGLAKQLFAVIAPAARDAAPAVVLRSSVMLVPVTAHRLWRGPGG